MNDTSPHGSDVPHLPADVERAYGEARRCMEVRAHTAAVLVARKILITELLLRFVYQVPVLIAKLNEGGEL